MSSISTRGEGSGSGGASRRKARSSHSAQRRSREADSFSTRYNWFPNQEVNPSFPLCLAINEISSSAVKKRWRDRFTALEITAIDNLTYIFAVERDAKDTAHEAFIQSAFRRIKEELLWRREEDGFAYPIDVIRHKNVSEAKEKSSSAFPSRPATTTAAAAASTAAATASTAADINATRSSASSSTPQGEAAAAIAAATASANTNTMKTRSSSPHPSIYPAPYSSTFGTFGTGMGMGTGMGIGVALPPPTPLSSSKPSAASKYGNGEPSDSNPAEVPAQDSLFSPTFESIASGLFSPFSPPSLFSPANTASLPSSRWADPSQQAQSQSSSTAAANNMPYPATGHSALRAPFSFKAEFDRFSSSRS